MEGISSSANVDNVANCRLLNIRAYRLTHGRSCIRLASCPADSDVVPRRIAADGTALGIELLTGVLRRRWST